MAKARAKRRGRPAGKLVWEKWYWDQWLSDEKLGQCSPRARGVWMELNGLMFKDESFFVSGTTRHVAMRCRMLEPELIAGCEELAGFGVADVTLCNGIVRVESRRRKRICNEREKTRKRVARYRDLQNGGGSGNAPCNAPCNGVGNGESIEYRVTSKDVTTIPERECNGATAPVLDGRGGADALEDLPPKKERMATEEGARVSALVPSWCPSIEDVGKTAGVIVQERGLEESFLEWVAQQVGGDVALASFKVLGFDSSGAEFLAQGFLAAGGAGVAENVEEPEGASAPAELEDQPYEMSEEWL